MAPGDSAGGGSCSLSDSSDLESGASCAAPDSKWDFTAQDGLSSPPAETADRTESTTDRGSGPEADRALYTCPVCGPDPSPRKGKDGLYYCSRCGRPLERVKK